MFILQKGFSIPLLLLLLSANTNRSQPNNSSVKLSLNSNVHNYSDDITRHSVTQPNENAIDYDQKARIYDMHLEKYSIIYGLIRVANASNINLSCYEHLQRIRSGIIRKWPWAIKALDASGTKVPGFVFGQNFWLGSQEACSAVRRPLDIKLSQNIYRVMNQGILKDVAPFDMDYRMIYLKHYSTWQIDIKDATQRIIQLGLCLPTSCSANEVENLITDYMKSDLFVENDIYDMQPNVLYSKVLKISYDFFERDSFKLLFCYVLFVLTMSLVAWYLRNTNQEDSSKSVNSIVMPNFPRLSNFIMCFDLQSNLSNIFSNSDTQATGIPVINGLRSICSVGIMLNHIIVYMYFTIHNRAFLMEHAEKLIFQHISSAPILVEVFFTISGFLQSYNFFRNTKKIEMIRNNSLLQNAKQMFNLAFHRCLRLVPLYLVVIAVVDLLFFYLAKVSVYDIYDKFDENCGNYWWRNLFFVQNLFDHKDMCLNWSWTIACEMQYFIIATVLLFVYVKHPRRAKAVVVTLILANIGWTYFIAYKTKLELSAESFQAALTDIYISPFVRILPYAIGAVVGWGFVQQRWRLMDWMKRHEGQSWHLSIFILFVSFYGAMVKTDASGMKVATTLVIGRFLFTMAVCWIIVGSATGRGTWWSRILETKAFQHFNRISYAFYLLNPWVISFFYGLTNNSTHMDPLFLYVVFAGFAVITYLASLIFSVAFEMPFCNWSLMLRKC